MFKIQLQASIQSSLELHAISRSFGRPTLIAAASQTGLAFFFFLPSEKKRGLV